MNGNKLMEAALGYAWKVIPLHNCKGSQCGCGKADCGSAGKHPGIASKAALLVVVGAILQTIIRDGP
jgi:hypothetical protein